MQGGSTTPFAEKSADLRDSLMDITRSGARFERRKLCAFRVRIALICGKARCTCYVQIKKVLHHATPRSRQQRGCMVSVDADCVRNRTVFLE